MSCCCCCCWPRSTDSGSKKGRRNLWHAFLKCFRKLCGCRKSLVRVAPEEVVSDVQIQDILRKHNYSPPRYRERLFLRPKDRTKGSHSFQILAQVHKSWQHDLETVEELPETPSQTEQLDSSECLPTVQEPSQTSDSTETDSKGAEETGELACLCAAPQGHAPPAGELGPSKTIQDAAGTPEDLELTAPLNRQLDTVQGPEGGAQAAVLIASLLGEPGQGLEDSGQHVGGELTPPLLGEADPDPPPTGCPEAATMTPPQQVEPGQGLEDSGQPVGGELTPPLLGEADPDPPPAGCPEAATMTPPQRAEPGPDHQNTEHTEVAELQL
ncbi:uncharacterized protein Rv2083-like [Talpa occidentalis]|uniref:uncharacterized protein Rv2083-like n=1 Tax=Talpa occidentalis TaxID=50954 RepID=UPI00188DF065|nr:uncharacterized protein Rv2083-like [Talpa occidentalis]